MQRSKKVGLLQVVNRYKLNAMLHNLRRSSNVLIHLSTDKMNHTNERCDYRTQYVSHSVARLWQNEQVKRRLCLCDDKPFCGRVSVNCLLCFFFAVTLSLHKSERSFYQFVSLSAMFDQPIFYGVNLVCEHEKFLFFTFTLNNIEFVIRS